MNQLLKDLWDNAEDFYETMRKSDVLTGDHYEGKRLKLFVDRRVLNDIWKQSKSDMKNGKETLGTLSGYLKKNRTNGDDCFEYYVTSATRLQSGLSEAEIDRKFGCLAPLIAGAVEIDKAFPFFENHTGVYHTHPLVTSLKYDSVRSGKDLDLPAEESSVDKESYSQITRDIKKAKIYDLCLLPFCVSTSYAEGKVVWDMVFQHILPKYSNAENPVEIKENVYSTTEFNDPILNRSFAAQRMGNSLKSFYEAATLGNYEAVVGEANKFLKRLNDNGYAHEKKLHGPDVNIIVKWAAAPVLWEIAREDAINNDVLSSFMIYMASANDEQSFRFPLYETLKNEALGFKRHPMGIEYYGTVSPSSAVAKFRQAYKKKFKKEFSGLASEMRESNMMISNSLDSLPEIRETFGYDKNPLGRILRMHRYVERLSAQMR